MPTAPTADHRADGTNARSSTTVSPVPTCGTELVTGERRANQMALAAVRIPARGFDDVSMPKELHGDVTVQARAPGRQTIVYSTGPDALL